MSFCALNAKAALGLPVSVSVNSEENDGLTTSCIHFILVITQPRKWLYVHTVLKIENSSSSIVRGTKGVAVTVGWSQDGASQYYCTYIVVDKKNN